MTTEEQLQELRAQIEYARKKAVSLRRRAEAQDRIADDKVKLAAELGTGELPIMNRTGMSDDPRASFTPDGTCRMD